MPRPPQLAREYGVKLRGAYDLQLAEAAVRQLQDIPTAFVLPLNKVGGEGRGGGGGGAGHAARAAAAPCALPPGVLWAAAGVPVLGCVPRCAPLACMLTAHPLPCHACTRTATDAGEVRCARAYI